MPQPLVSILIPCYNAAPWLRATLESALAQTWPHREIILVDDGSTDDSLRIARTFEPRGVQVVAQPNRGACAARNHARRLARGDFLQYLDADDLLLPDKIERQLHLAQTPAAANCLISGEWARFFADPSTAFAKSDALWTDLDPVAWQVAALSHNLMIHPAAWLTPRALSDAAGEWDETLTLNDDGEYFCRVRFAARRILFCSGARSLYRSGLPGSLSSPLSRRALTSAYRSHELIHARLLAAEDTPRTRQACADAWMQFAFTAAARADDLATAAVQHAHALGGSRLRPEGGRLFRTVSRLAGWRRALHLQRRWLRKERTS